MTTAAAARRRRWRRIWGAWNIAKLTPAIIESQPQDSYSCVSLRRDTEEECKDLLFQSTEPKTIERMDMFAAATDTTGTVLEWAMSELVRHPKAMAKAQTEIREVLGDRAVITNSDFGELHYMRMVIKETLRMHPPAPLIPRTTREDCKIMGYDMLKGTNVYINVFAVSRDPKYWKNPEEFDPERFENLHDMDYHGTHFEYTPFGAGRRQCPGILFGVSTIEIVLANLLYHFDWVLPGGLSPESLDMSEKFGITVSRRSDLQLRAIQRLC